MIANNDDHNALKQIAEKNKVSLGAVEHLLMVMAPAAGRWRNSIILISVAWGSGRKAGCS